MAISLDPHEQKEPMEYAIDRWLQLIDYTHHDVEIMRENPIMIQLPLYRIHMLQNELSAFKAGFKQGRLR